MYAIILIVFLPQPCNLSIHDKAVIVSSHFDFFVLFQTSLLLLLEVIFCCLLFLTNIVMLNNINPNTNYDSILIFKPAWNIRLLIVRLMDRWHANKTKDSALQALLLSY